MKPEFIKAAQHFINEKSEIILAAVDISVQTALEKRFSITEVPTFKFFIDGKIIEYTGGSTAEELIKWIKETHSEL